MGRLLRGDCRYREHVRGWLVRPARLKQVTLTQRSSWPCWSLPEAVRSVGSGGWSVKQQHKWLMIQTNKEEYVVFRSFSPFLQMCPAPHQRFWMAALDAWLPPGLSLWTRAGGKAWSCHQTSLSWWGKKDQTSQDAQNETFIPQFRTVASLQRNCCFSERTNKLPLRRRRHVKIINDNDFSAADSELLQQTPHPVRHNHTISLDDNFISCCTYCYIAKIKSTAFQL